MLSSISSSNESRAMRAIVVLLILLGLYFASLEAAMRTVIPRQSGSVQRARADYAAALALGPAPGVSGESVLVVGNSLLLHGIDRRLLSEALEPQHQVAVLPVENTGALDWSFGLRRMFEEGTRPSVIVLSVNARQTAANSTNGEPFASSMMRRADFFHVVRAARLDNTTASAYFFATFSEWLGQRSGFRNFLLERWLPGAGLLVPAFVPPTAPQSNEQTVERAIPRLREIAELCARHGARFIYLVPASKNSADAAPMLVRAATDAGLTALMPIAPGEMPDESFSDGFHLNKSGAATFTGKLAPLLRDALSER
jgi:hypothetical protein